MEPTLADLEVVVAKRPESVPKVGDIVVFPLMEEEVVKRVVATGGRLYRHNPSGTALYMPQDQVFVQGDNPEQSFDSRHFGPINVGAIDFVVVYSARRELAQPR